MCTGSAEKAAETEKELAKDAANKARKRNHKVISPLDCFLFFAFSAAVLCDLCG